MRKNLPDAATAPSVMENAWSNGKTKVLKPRTSNENVPSLQIDMDDKRGRYLQPNTMSPRYQPYAAENVDVGSPLARYLFAGSPFSAKVAGEAFTPPTFGASKYRTSKAQHYCGSGSSSYGSRGRLSPSPLSSLENMEIASLMSPPMYRAPPKGDDDVIVMDDILVRPVSGGKSGRSSSSSGRGSSSSTSSTARSVFRTDICRAWEEPGNCRYNSRCQFGPQKEESRSTKSKSGEEILQSSTGAESSTHGPSSPIVHQQSTAVESEHEVSTSQPPSTTSETKPGTQIVESSIPAASSTHGQSSPIVHQQSASAESDHEVSTSQPPSPEVHHTLANLNTFEEWSPFDDGIEVVLPNASDRTPSREEVEGYISSSFLGRTSKRRLPIFEAICPGD
ncbi:hypothetical protein Fmac_005054 [Flemingia macrophylla]|uniref:C3H1-type domain-containing protein n=1 Tax=Flemingia macrophylla TaxID=520843 RepID=A0ABD1N6U9_9FABA